MVWKNLLQPTHSQRFCLPWLGGRELQTQKGYYKIVGRLPENYGWYQYLINNRKVSIDSEQEEPKPELLSYNVITGYLCGDNLISDQVSANQDPFILLHQASKVHLLESGLDRFARIQAASWYENGPLVFKQADMPLGPESEILMAFLNQEPISSIKNVSPALEACFKVEIWRREEAEKRRKEAEELALKRQKEEEERVKREQFMASIGSSVGRRNLATVDFVTAARAALAVSGAEYLDSFASHHSDEMVVRYRFRRRMFESVVGKYDLGIRDAGICLTGEDGFRHDSSLTLESICSVIAEAMDDGVLHVFRHVY